MYTFSQFAQFDFITHGITGRDAAVPKECEPVVRGEQVHRDRSQWVDTSKPVIVPNTDALMTKQIGLTLGVAAADCAPILFVEPHAKIIGAIHAGWRGTALEITRKTIEALKIRPFKLRVGIGPAICGNCFEVGEEVARQFERSVVRQSDTEEGKWFVDLWQANVNHCLELGIPERNIEVIRECTYENPDLYSFRNGDRRSPNIAFIRKIA